MDAKLIDGRAIADSIKEEVIREAAILSQEGINLRLVAVQAGENPASAVYVKQQKKNCEKAGISYELKSISADITEACLLEEIEKLNSDSTVTGIILQMPLPEGIDARKVQAAISVAKDVEGVNPSNMGWVIYGRPFLAPCTALAVKEIIDATGVHLYGKEVVIVGHSDIVGKPVALLLLDKFATVSVCHIGTSEAGMLEEHVRRADILVVAVGRANVIPGEWVKEGAVVVDVGINRVGDKIAGDVEFDSASKKASFITPVPGGVGPVTTAILLRNVVKAAKWTKNR
ncbi:MAG TPA: bifunctional 5,10-methylenetetrahydrofolate dehydrogenase/5,10-methenyltetrahydrofolate cyclohydrolase [bacterium]|jgi:methylenetetrahydrofolate dehydrogenase (NADP+)/methenyltetrahydrofolate cyclohydrolase|nr:bifunctional 5,10-methylenetetrahydrofolate dehydrogenase/5,10-methenyltetrahydrofolate cyclohydrolase [bacterium]